MANSRYNRSSNPGSSRKKRATRARKKASEIFRSGKAQQSAADLSSATLNQVVSDAQGRSSQKDRKAAQSASQELARRGGGSRPKRKKRK